VDEDGRVLGEHKGLIRYTIGQRKGLGLALPHPMYVKAKDMEKNEVILSENSGLYSSRLEAGDFNWIWWPGAEKTCHSEDIENGTGQQNAGACAGQRRPAPGTVLRATAKPRYRAVEAAGTAVVLDDGGVSFTFDEPQRALTLGQALVLYDGERVIGGGTITRVPRT
jgi:tRNA-specific 2-thiouridylase